MLLDLWSDPPASARGGVISVGNFDGLHRGHHRLLAVLREQAREQDVPAVVVSFEPHPVSVLRPQDAPQPLLWPERKQELLLAAGADHVILYRTTRQLLGLSAEEFFCDIVLEKLGARGMVEGPNFGFGRDRAGNVKLLERLCAEHGLCFDLVDLFPDSGLEISSTRIRQLLGKGDLWRARQLLGRPHRLQGTVIVGRKRGSELGFPTINLDRISTLVPAEGVYAVYVWFEGQPHAGACNIGPNPTFEEENPKVEVHLLDYDGDLYGKTLEVDLLARIREIQTFRDSEELKEQIGRDIDRVRSLLATEPAVSDPSAAELSKTIEEWLRLKFDPVLEPLEGRLVKVALLEDSCLRVHWHLPRPTLPTDTFGMLGNFEDRIRQIFPEVGRVEFEGTPRE